MVKRKEDIQADFIAGEYVRILSITARMKKLRTLNYLSRELQPENQFKPERVSHNPNCILLQTRAEDKNTL